MPRMDNLIGTTHHLHWANATPRLVGLAVDCIEPEDANKCEDTNTPAANESRKKDEVFAHRSQKGKGSFLARAAGGAASATAQPISGHAGAPQALATLAVVTRAIGRQECLPHVRAGDVPACRASRPGSERCAGCFRRRWGPGRPLPGRSRRKSWRRSSWGCWSGCGPSRVPGP